MPNIPNVPGVPALSSYASGPLPQLLADVSLAASLLLPSQWGIFLNGVPVIQPASALTTLVAPLLSDVALIASVLGFPGIIPVIASTVDFEFSQEWPVSNYPQEQGAFQSYNKLSLPYDVKVVLTAGGSPTTRQAFISTCLAIGNAGLQSASPVVSTVISTVASGFAGQPLPLFDIVTPELVFTSMTCIHVDWKRSARQGLSLIAVDMWFKQVPVTATSSFQNTLEPGNASQSSIGNVQPQEFSSQQQTSTGNPPAPTVGEFQ